MDIYKLAVAGINVNEGIKRFNRNAGLYEKLLKKFADDKNYSTMCVAIAAGNVSSAFTAAHALKGTAGNLSLTKLYQDISPLVELLRSGSLDGVDKLLTPVTKDRQTILTALEES